MADTRPSTSGRAEKERQAIGGMWVYVQPMSMYNHIQQRQQAQASFLRRNLTYHRPKTKCSADRYTEMCIQLDSAGGQPLFVVLCKKVAQPRKSLMAFEPLSVQLSDASGTLQEDTHTLQFQVPHQHQHSQSQLGILAIASNDVSLSHIIEAFKLKKRPRSSDTAACGTTSRLTKDCTTRMAFGVIPSGSDVCWQFAPLPTSWPSSSAAHPHAESVPPVHAKMQRKRGTLQMALGRNGCLLQLSNQNSGAFFGVRFSLSHPSYTASRPASASASCSAGDRQATDGATCSLADRSNNQSAASTSAPNSQGNDAEWGRVRFRYHFHIGERRFHCIEATSNFACFACSQTCKGLLGLQQHIEASHDLFDFSYPTAELGGSLTEGVSSWGVPTITVGCPDNLFDQQGNLQTLETDDLESVDGKEMGFFCPKRLRRLRLDQYNMTEQQRRGLDIQLTHNKFRKAAWKLWHDSSPAAAFINKAAQSAAPSGRSPPALPMRPFPEQPLRSESQARAASHAAASTSSSGNLAAGHKRLVGNVDASGSGSGNARLGKPPQPQAPPRKKPRVQAHPPSVHDVTEPPPVYFHARSCTRMTPQDVTRILQDPHAVPDSDDEEDQTQWKERATRQLDNQTNLSAAERDLMLRWNVYLHDYPCLSDAQMSQRCRDIAAVAADDMQRDPDLRRCFLVHLINLWEFNLVTAAVVDECMALTSYVQV